MNGGNGWAMKFWEWLAWRLPRWLLFYAVVRAGALASRKYSDLTMGELNPARILEALRD